MAGKREEKGIKLGKVEERKEDRKEERKEREAGRMEGRRKKEEIEGRKESGRPGEERKENYGPFSVKKAKPE